MNKLLILFTVILTGCATSYYSVMPENDECFNRKLYERDRCTTETVKETARCYRRIKDECASEWAERLLRQGKRGGQ